MSDGLHRNMSVYYRNRRSTFGDIYIIFFDLTNNFTVVVIWTEE